VGTRGAGDAGAREEEGGCGGGGEGAPSQSQRRDHARTWVLSEWGKGEGELERARGREGDSHTGGAAAPGDDAVTHGAAVVDRGPGGETVPLGREGGGASPPLSDRLSSSSQRAPSPSPSSHYHHVPPPLQSKGGGGPGGSGMTGSGRLPATTSVSAEERRRRVQALWRQLASPDSQSGDKARARVKKREGALDLQSGAMARGRCVCLF
jgi:hypothetical protein